MPDQTSDEHNSSRNPDHTSNQDQDERVLLSTAPDADELDDIQETIE
ncbi:MAG: hypothetical protein ACKVJL_01910 [Dehalococcoidia bacterium]|jgi:hypothetical protein